MPHTDKCLCERCMMPKLQKTRTHDYDCSCIDCGVTRSLSPVTSHGLNCSCHQCHMNYTTTTNTSGVLPNTYTVSGSTEISTSILCRPCGRPWSVECSCHFCFAYQAPQLSFKFAPEDPKPTFRTMNIPGKTEEVGPSDFKKDVVSKVASIQALNKALAFLSGLNLQNHPVKDQREQADVLREIMKVLKPERFDK